MDDYSTGLAQIIDGPAPGPRPITGVNIGIRPWSQRGIPDGDGMTPVGVPEQPPAAQPQTPVQQPKTFTLHPVDHKPEFEIKLQPVDHVPEFVDEPAKPQLSDEQMRTLAIQVKGGAITQGPHDVMRQGGQALIQPTIDAFDPFKKDEHGHYVADQPMVPNAQGKVPEVYNDPTLALAAGADLASNFITPGISGALAGAGKAMFFAAKAGPKLVRAEQMAKEAAAMTSLFPNAANDAAREIWHETGLFRGADGRWLYEVPDTDARFYDPHLWRTNLREQAAENYRKMDKIKARNFSQPGDIDHHRQLQEQASNLFNISDNPQVPLEAVLDHPELYRTIPTLRDMKVGIKDLGGSVKGGHIPAPFGQQHGSIELDAETGANRSVTLHEVMHEVQDIQGRAKGGNLSTPEVAREAEAQTGLKRANLLAEAQAIADQKNAWIETQMPKGYGLETWKNSFPKDYEKLADKWWHAHPEAQREFMRLNADAQMLNAAHQRLLRDAYMRLAGEVEARNVQHRAGMSSSELKRTPPFETEDRPRETQIVNMNHPHQPRSASAAMDDEGAAAARVNDGLHETGEPVRGDYEQGTHQAGAEAAAHPEAAVRVGGGAGGVEEARRAAESAAAATRPLEDLPQAPVTIRAPGGDVVYVPGPIERVHKIAEDYMASTGRKFEPITSFRPVQVKRAERIAEQYDRMKHAPNDPAVKASYDAMIKETIDQLKFVQKSGLKIEFIKPGMENPYEASPRMATMDVRDNNHLWVFATDSGFGSGNKLTAAEIANNPLLADTGIVIDGHRVLANDAFRIVHDFFGHVKDGVGFRASGEENAWRSHSRMYSPLARKAMTSETRGQNSWLNYGPHGEKNRTAKGDTIYADQKTGIMPNWTYLDGAADHFARPDPKVINAGVDAPVDKSMQTVADPHRMMYPGVYENPKRIAREAAERVAPEDINMKRLWGVSRGDLDEMAKTRKGNRDPEVYKGPGVQRGALSAQNIQTPQNTQRIQDILGEAGKHPGLKHADAWYILDPVYQHMEKMFGPEEARARFDRLNTLMGMSSPGSEVMTEIQRGTAANMKVEQGRFDEFAKFAGTPREFRKGPEDLRRVEAHPYHRTAQAEPMEKYLDTGKIQSREPKVPTYVGASGAPETGFQTRGPVGDSHFSRGVGLADTRKGPTDVASSLTNSEYHTLQPWWENEVAGEMGLESVPAQARLWTALGPRTGVTSALGQGKLELLTKQIMVAAKRLGITPEAARDLILSGKAHAGMLAGGAVAGGVLADGLQPYIDQ